MATNYQRRNCTASAGSRSEPGTVNVCFNLDPQRLNALSVSGPTPGNKNVFCDIVVTHEQARFLAQSLLDTIEAMEEEMQYA